MMVDDINYETRYYVHPEDEEFTAYDYFSTLEDAISSAEDLATDYSQQYAVTEIMIREIGTTQVTVRFEKS